MSEGDPRDDASSAASPFPAAYGAVGGSAADPSTRAPGRRPLSERRTTEGDDTPSASARVAGAIRKRQQSRLARVGTPPPPAAVPPPGEAADPEPDRTTVGRPGRRRVAPDPAGTWERPSTGVTPVEGSLVAPTAVQSTVAPRVAPASPRRGPAPPLPDPSGPETPQLDRRERRTPDWMAQRVAESVAHDAPFEIGKERRWRRRKVTVMRTRANRRMVRRIDTWTVFKVSFVFYLLMVIVVLIAGLVTWSVAQHLGFVSDIQKSVRSLADDKKFILHGSVAFRYSAAGGAVLGLVGTLLNTVAAMLYNLLSDVIGGIQVIVVTEPD